ncbi:hypothetical protein O1611_g1579 [Lasiodiplodia mahajangana]|uniref:Uncharacterized protein n=1 Tax=Lasiodiplodia mahajangana TaxID=1108764 RepID=A0ACC2JXM0_9PEZI|nr:hypothetical protein O1611_g1579 [Lasiodiplodia mahajangana]
MDLATQNAVDYQALQNSDSWNIREALERSGRSWDSLCACQCRLCRLIEQVGLVALGGRYTNFGESDHKLHRPNISEKTFVNIDKRREPSLAPAGLIVWSTTMSWFELFKDAEDRSDFKVEGHSFRPGIPFGLGTNSEGTFRRAKRWLDQCVANHDCRQKHFDRRPKRLLNIRGDQIHLVETDDTEYKYVCLSHRWGGPEHRRLASTAITVQRHMNGIKWEDVPKTFQDAVTICRRLKVDYLWIDTLCILQECPGLTETQIEETKEDFVKENLAMASIYSGSYFTISADISKHMDSGIFTSPDPRRQSNPLCHGFTVKNDNGQTSNVYATVSYQHSQHRTNLETRGWTLQESIIPARVLHFGERDVTWRCREKHTCECGYISQVGIVSSWRTKLGKLARPPPEDLGGRIKWWYDVVSLYMPRELSRKNDKLPALSGLAQIYRNETKYTYMAGLWEETLYHELCWYHDITYNTSAPLRVGPFGAWKYYRAPTWSWASIDYPDDYSYRLCSFTVFGTITDKRLRACNIIKAVCQPRTSDLTGEVRPDCYIELEARLFSATIQLGDPFGEESGIEFTAPPWTLGNIEDTEINVGYCFPDCRMKDDDLKVGDEVYYAPITEAVHQHYSTGYCLVLKLVEGQRYRRVGLCVMHRGNHYETDNPEWQRGEEAGDHASRFHVKNSTLQIEKILRDFAHRNSNTLERLWTMDVRTRKGDDLFSHAAWIRRNFMSNTSYPLPVWKNFRGDVYVVRMPSPMNPRGNRGLGVDSSAGGNSRRGRHMGKD